MFPNVIELRVVIEHTQYHKIQKDSNIQNNFFHSLNRDERADMTKKKKKRKKKEENPYTVHKYMYSHYLDVWTKLDTFYVQKQSNLPIKQSPVLKGHIFLVCPVRKFHMN